MGLTFPGCTGTETVLASLAFLWMAVMLIATYPRRDKT